MCKLVLFSRNTGFRLVSVLMTLNDLEQHNDRRRSPSLQQPSFLFAVRLSAFLVSAIGTDVHVWAIYKTRRWNDAIEDDGDEDVSFGDAVVCEFVVCGLLCGDRAELATHWRRFICHVWLDVVHWRSAAGLVECSTKRQRSTFQRPRELGTARQQPSATQRCKPHACLIRCRLTKRLMARQLSFPRSRSQI